MYADSKYDISDDILDDMGYKLNKTKGTTTPQQKSTTPTPNGRTGTGTKPDNNIK